MFIKKERESVKRLTVIEGLLIALLAISTSTCVIAVTGGLIGFKESPEGYKWRMAIEPGKGCFQENCAPGSWAMAIVPLTAFDNRLFIIGQKSIWSSSNGIKWSTQAKTDWGERNGMAYVFFDNKLWMLGGMRSWDDFKNDVWYSSDGKNWKIATANAPWAPRRNHSVLIHDNKMWLLGGAASSGQANQLPSRFFNDVWSSTDGVNWTQVTASASWPSRDNQTAVVFKNRLWILGGVGRRDVWSSTDGKTWTQASATAQWSERLNNGGLVFDGRMWVFGGRGLNDVWYSSDGKRWQLAFAQAPWSTRTAFHSVVFDNKLWIYGGKTGRADSWTGDVWIMINDELKTTREPE
jgi:hypothetical protein